MFSTITEGSSQMNDAPSVNTLIPSLSKGTNTRSLKNAIIKYRWLFLLMIPGVAYFIIFRYLPLWNAQIAFKGFKPLLGVLDSPFAGLNISSLFSILSILNN